jgi:hypothetical protein
MRHAPLLLAMIVAQGCAGRRIVSIEDGPSGTGARTTVLSTVESFSIPVIGFNSAKKVFWECGEAAGGLVCKQVCDVKDDEGDILACQKLTPF